jgi:hypothetical protein
VATSKQVFQHVVTVLPTIGLVGHIYYIENGNGTDLDKYVVDSNGALRFVGSRPSAGGALINFADEVSLTGVVNNINKIFTLPQVPITGSLKIYLNGQRLKNNYDYTYIGNTITFVDALFIGDVTFADYRY